MVLVIMLISETTDIFNKAKVFNSKRFSPTPLKINQLCAIRYQATQRDYDRGVEK